MRSDRPCRRLTLICHSALHPTRQADFQAYAPAWSRGDVSGYGALPSGLPFGLAPSGGLPGEAVDRFEVDFADSDQRHGVDLVEIDWGWNEQARQPGIGQPFHQFVRAIDRARCE